MILLRYFIGNLISSILELKIQWNEYFLKKCSLMIRIGTAYLCSVQRFFKSRIRFIFFLHTLRLATNSLQETLKGSRIGVTSFQLTWMNFMICFPQFFGIFFVSELLGPAFFLFLFFFSGIQNYSLSSSCKLGAIFFSKIGFIYSSGSYFSSLSGDSIERELLSKSSLLKKAFSSINCISFVKQEVGLSIFSPMTSLLFN